MHLAWAHMCAVWGEHEGGDVDVWELERRSWRSSRRTFFGGLMVKADFGVMERCESFAPLKWSLLSPLIERRIFFFNEAESPN
jgi:hypothetical protein